MDRRANVAFVTPTLDVMGGTEQIVGLEARALMQHANITFFTQEGQPTEIVGTEVCPVKHLKLPGVLGTEAWFHAATLAVQTHPTSFDAIYSPGINCACATHINVYANFSEWVDISRDVPIKGSLIELQRRLRFRRLAEWEKKLYTNPKTKLATISHLAAQRLEHDFRRQDITVFPSTPEPNRFTPEYRQQERKRARRMLGLDIEELAVFTIGNAWHSKGFDLLFEVWRDERIEKAGTLLIVTSEREEHLKKMCGAIPKWVRLLPQQRQIEHLYAAADLVILASRGETFGLPIAESGAMDVSVLVSRHAGVSGYLPEQCVVAINNTETWKTAIQNFVHNGQSANTKIQVQKALSHNDPEKRAKAFVDWILS